MDQLLELVCTLDRELPWRTAFSEDCHELFVLLFKATYYGKEIQYSVENKHGDVVLAIDDHDALCWALSKIQRTESQINYVINNLLTKVIAAIRDKLNLLISSAELMYSTDSIKSTKRVAKVVSIFSKLYSTIHHENESRKSERSKFLQGSLFVLGGLLKIEAKSYLHTKNEQALSSKSGEKVLVCPLINPENELEDA